jgi:hypothetical protein
MKYSIAALSIFALTAAALFSFPDDPSTKAKTKKVELPHPFYWAAPDPLRGDWQGQGGYVAQVVRVDDKILSAPDLIPQAADAGKYKANIFRKVRRA